MGEGTVSLESLEPHTRVLTSGIPCTVVVFSGVSSGLTVLVVLANVHLGALASCSQLEFVTLIRTACVRSVLSADLEVAMRKRSSKGKAPEKLQK